MNPIPGLSKYRAWLNQKTLPQYHVAEIIELGAFWTETILLEEKTGRQFWSRLYHIEPQNEEALKGLWQDLAYPLEGLNEDHLQKPIGLKKVGDFLAYLSNYEPGIDLKSLLHQCGHLRPNRAIVLLLQAIKSLESVYARGAAHFQLKPSNIILSPMGQVIVKNFGLYEIENLLGRQIGAQHLWDVAYFSPEHFGDQELTIASDIYSLGLVLFEMVTGKQPFSGQYQDVMNAQMKSMPPNPQALNPDINVGLSRVMLRMLSKKKNQRFQSFSELREALFLLLSPLEQAMFRSFTIGTDPVLDDGEAEALRSGFALVKSMRIQGDAKESLSKLEELIRMYGVREEFEDFALELADLIHHDKLEIMVQKAEDFLQNGFPFKAISKCEHILAIHPFHSGARNIFRKAYNLLDYRPLMALQPAIATDLHLKIARESNTEKALFVLSRVLLSDPRNEAARKAMEQIAGGVDPVEEKLEMVRIKRDQGDFTEALALVDSFLTQQSSNRRALLLKKQITEQIHLMSLSKFSESGETIPISIDSEIGDFSIEPDDHHLLEEGILNIQISIQNKKLASAEKELRALEEQFPGDPALAELAHRLKEVIRKEHIEKLEKRLKQLVQLGDDKGASAMVSEILKLDPSHGFAKATLANLAQKREEQSESRKLSEEILALEKQGEISEALSTLKSKLLIVPRTHELLKLEQKLEQQIKDQSERDWLVGEAQTMIHKGNREGASEKIRHILARFPGDPKALALKSALTNSQPPAATVPLSSPVFTPTPPQPVAPGPPAYQPPFQPMQAVNETVPLPVMPVQPPQTTAAAPEPKKKKSMHLIPVFIVLLILGGTGAGYVFYKNKQKNDRLMTAYKEAERVQSEVGWEQALPLWQSLAKEAPEFQGSLGRLRDLEAMMQTKKDQVEALMTNAESYKNDGYIFDESNQNAVVMLRKVFALDPENTAAKQMYQDILAEEMESVSGLFNEGRILEAREKYATLKLIEPTYSDADFEGKIAQWENETVISPALLEIEKQIDRKKWDKALELSEQLKQQIDSVPALDALWDTVFKSLQEKIQGETRKSVILQSLELMAQIRPDDQALLIEKNELNRELNQAKIDDLFEKMETAYKKKQFISAGTHAKKLLALDSEHELAKTRLYDVIGQLKRQAEQEALSNPSQAIETYRSLLQIENVRTYRDLITQLQGKISRFKSSVDKVRLALNKPYDQLSSLVTQAENGSAGFEKEPDYQFIQDLKAGIAKENEALTALKAWEEGVRDDSTKSYESILDHIRKVAGLKYGFSKQEQARLVNTYEDKIENYTGELTLVFKTVTDLPKGAGLRKTPDASAEITLGSETCQTESVKSMNPVWNHICRFNVQPGDSIIIRINAKGLFQKQSEIGALRLPKIPLTGKDLRFTSPDGWTAVMDVRRER